MRWRGNSRRRGRNSLGWVARSPPTLLSGGASLLAAKSLQNSERCGSTVGSTPCPSAKLFERSLLPRFELVDSRLVPIRRLALRANPRFANGAFAGHPFVLAPIAF